MGIKIIWMMPHTIILLGPQGSGKGTQAKILKEKLGAEFLEMGGMLREVAKQDTEFGKHIRDLIENGYYVPDEDVERLLAEKFDAVGFSKPLIFDGVPRKMGQADFLMNELKKHNRDEIHTVHISLPREESIRRLSARRTCENCSSTVNLLETPDVVSCPNCGGNLVQRKDDTPEFIERRLKQNEELTTPVIEYLKEKTSFHDINGFQSVDEVARDIEKALGI